MPSPRPARAIAPAVSDPVPVVVDAAPVVADPGPAPAPPAPAPAVPADQQEPAERQPASRRSSTGYLGALWIIAPLMPGLAAVVTVGTYLFLPTAAGVGPATPAYPATAVVVGVVATAVVWFGGAFFARALVSAPRAQLRLYAELLERTRSLRDRATQLAPASPEDRAASEEARTHVDYATKELEGDGSGPALRWALASGYMSVLRALHRADEALIIVEPADAAVGDALHDALSLEGSAIGNRERLLDIVRIAMHRLSPGSAASFMSAVTDAPADDKERINENQAREALREVRHALNEFRDDRHDGLIRARNRLVWTMLAVGLSTYLLLSLALVAGVPIKYIQTVAVLYLDRGDRRLVQPAADRGRPVVGGRGLRAVDGAARGRAAGLRPGRGRRCLPDRRRAGPPPDGRHRRGGPTVPRGGLRSGRQPDLDHLCSDLRARSEHPDRPSRDGLGATQKDLQSTEAASSGVGGTDTGGNG